MDLTAAVLPGKGGNSRAANHAALMARAQAIGVTLNIEHVAGAQYRFHFEVDGQKTSTNSLRQGVNSAQNLLTRLEAQVAEAEAAAPAAKGKRS